MFRLGVQCSMCHTEEKRTKQDISVKNEYISKIKRKKDFTCLKYIHPLPKESMQITELPLETTMVVACI